MHLPHRFLRIPLVLFTLIASLVGMVASRPITVHATSNSSGSGSVVGDNIEAIVQFDSPATNTDSTCEWRPVLVLSNGGRNAGNAVNVIGTDGVSRSLYARLCTDASSNAPSEYFWVRDDASPRAAVTANNKVSKLVNMLLTRTAPPMDKMMVNVGTWFWVPSAVWKPLSVTAYIPTAAGVIAVTTTATPKTLIYSPGDGRPSVSCTGPGKPWSRSDGDNATSPCMYTYRSASHTRASRTYNANMAVQWRVTWRSNLGLSGNLPSIRTGLNSSVRVLEMQALAQ